MYKVKVQSHFSSAHNLRGYKGRCEELHGHNWDVEVVVSSESVNEIGMVVDFKDLKSALDECINELDHRHLNEVEYFKKANPTSENIARYIFDTLVENNPALAIKEVSVWETDSSSAVYSAQRE